MADAFERFLSGDDRLTGLLTSLPAYQPSARQQDAFASAARSAQASQTPHPGNFEPPERLASGFRSLAARLEHESSAQRRHILRRIDAGTHPDEILRQRMHPATTRWLRLQAAQLRRHRKQRFRRLRRAILDSFGWPELRLAGLAAICGGLAARWVLLHMPSPMEVALLDAFRNEVSFRAAMTVELPRPATAPSKAASVVQAPEKSAVASVRA